MSSLASEETLYIYDKPFILKNKKISLTSFSKKGSRNFVKDKVC
jgi:hypothetical protein